MIEDAVHGVSIDACRIMLGAGDPQSEPMISMFGKLFHQRHDDLDGETLFTQEPEQVLLRLSASRPSIVLVHHRIGRTADILRFIARLKDKNPQAVVVIFSSGHVDPLFEKEPIVDGIVQLGHPDHMLGFLAWRDLSILREQFVLHRHGKPNALPVPPTMSESEV